MHKIKDKEYFAHPALNASKLKLLRKNPALFTLPSPPATASMNKGTLVHAILFDNEDTLRVVDTLDKRTKEGKENHRLAGESPEVLFVTQNDYLEAQAIVKAILSIDQNHNLLQGNALKEVSCFWRNHNIEFKAKIDQINLESGAIIDLKMTLNASPDSFPRDAYKYGYHISASHYLEGAKEVTGQDFKFYFLAVETSYPYFSAIYELTNEELELGKRERLALIETYKTCVAFDYFPNFKPLSPLKFPPWAFRNEGDCV